MDVPWWYALVRNWRLRMWIGTYLSSGSGDLR